MPELIRDLAITALVHGGRGLGHHHGKAVFVPLTAPGDRVDCRIRKEKRRYIEAELVEIVAAAAERRDPPCPYFGDCGGCQWQHLPYSVQVAWKDSLFQDQLVRGGVADSTCFEPLVPSPDEWRYRNRAQFKCHMTAAGLVIGFHRAGTHFVVDIAECRLVRPEIQRVLVLLRQELPNAPAPQCLPQVDVACGDDGSVRVVLHALPHVREATRAWLEAFAGRHQLQACLQSGRKDTLATVRGTGDLPLTVDTPPMTLWCGAGGFAQVNSAQNRSMVTEMISRLELQGRELVIDLFCGMGNFGLPLARRAARLVGIEDYAPSIESARRNAAANQVDNVAFRVADAAALGGTCDDQPDLVVLDPPRTGHYQAIHAIARLQPERILYISCEPATLVRDLKPLVHGGYRIAWSRAFDLFPQTGHIESMTLLKRLGGRDKGER